MDVRLFVECSFVYLMIPKYFAVTAVESTRHIGGGHENQNGFGRFILYSTVSVTAQGVVRQARAKHEEELLSEIKSRTVPVYFGDHLARLCQ